MEGDDIVHASWKHGDKCNEKVVGSSPTIGAQKLKHLRKAGEIPLFGLIFDLSFGRPSKLLFSGASLAKGQPGSNWGRPTHFSRKVGVKGGISHKNINRSDEALGFVKKLI